LLAICNLWLGFRVIHVQELCSRFVLSKQCVRLVQGSVQLLPQLSYRSSFLRAVRCLLIGPSIIEEASFFGFIKLKGYF